MPPLRIALGAYERVRALRTGEVRPDGVDLEVTTLAPTEILERMAARPEFDAGEFSLSDALRAFASGERRYAVLPVFTYRAFRHSMVWVPRASDLGGLGDLRGKRVGIGAYASTALLFLRGVLADEHAVVPADVTWVRTAPERAGVRTIDVRIEDVRERLDDLLARGAVDAVASFTVPVNARRLVPNVRDVEAAYYERTRIFPIMHVVVLRASLHEDDPTLAPRLVAAFEQAKQHAYDEVRRSGSVAHSLTPWSRFEVEETAALFGDDAFPYGVEPNRPTLEAACRYARAQYGLDLPSDIATLFTPGG